MCVDRLGNLSDVMLFNIVSLSEREREEKERRRYIRGRDAAHSVVQTHSYIDRCGTQPYQSHQGTSQLPSYVVVF